MKPVAPVIRIVDIGRVVSSRDNLAGVQITELSIIGYQNRVCLIMVHPVKSWNRAIRKGFVSGAVASITSTISLSVLGKTELGDSAAPMNGPSQWIWGKHAPYQNRFTLRYTIIGYVIHHAASVFWAIWYERLRQRITSTKTGSAVLAPAVMTTVAAYVVDFHFTPKRLTPGFERRLSQRSLLIVYGTFALGLAATALLGRWPARQAHTRKKPAALRHQRHPASRIR